MPNITEEKWIEMLEKKADGTYIAKYPKVKSKSGVTFDEHLAETASTTTRGHVQLSSAVNSTREDLAATPKAVKMAYDKANEKPFVVGTYTGNNSPSRTISLGFRPSAVYVVSRYGHAESGSGGFALDGYSVHTNIGYDIISITSNGFNVYYNPDRNVHSNSNSSSLNPFRYIAFK